MGLGSSKPRQLTSSERNTVIQIINSIDRLVSPLLLNSEYILSSIDYNYNQNIIMKQLNDIYVTINQMLINNLNLIIINNFNIIYK